MELRVITGKPPAATDWRCAGHGCNTLLGKRYPNGSLVIKYKETITEVVGNFTLSSRCRRCLLSNIISVKSHGVLSLLKEQEERNES